MGKWMVIAAACLAVACSKTADPLRITGSSTVFPFTRTVADAFVKAQAGRPRPILEASGTGPGIRAFCGSADAGSPDIVNASRRMTRAEYDRCATNGVKDVIEVRIGLDGIALAEAAQGPKFQLTRKDLYLALAANPGGKPNTARLWRDVNPTLPALAIKVLGPPPDDGTRDQFVDLLLEPGCLAAVPEAKAMQTAPDPSVFDRTCRQIRADGAYVAEGENDEATARQVERDPQALGLFGYSYLERNAGRLRGVPIDGVAPDYAAISSGTYPGARTLFLYVKHAHLKSKPDLQAFLDLYATMWAPGGPLTRQGLIAMSDGARERAAATIKNGEVLDREALF